MSVDKNLNWNELETNYNHPQKGYQPKLTKKLDALKEPFSQNTINEIVLWKVNRYTELPAKLLEKINKISPDEKEIDAKYTVEILQEMLATKGIRLPMASTILKFRNPQIYQIIDQRVYRYLYKKVLPLHQTPELYIEYLTDLRTFCKKENIDFTLADRLLYLADKKFNKQPIKY